MLCVPPADPLSRPIARWQERASAAEKAQRAAESSLGALKAQAGGLEKEYDRWDGGGCAHFVWEGVAGWVLGALENEYDRCGGLANAQWC